jgi:formamidopyrimidine-DNA glycosylase
MPELPEVETVRRIIEPQLIGQTILSVSVSNPQIIAYPDATAFAALLTGQTVRRMSRRGKFLTVHFESGGRMVIHLRMTGQLLVTPADYPVEKHTHLQAALSGGSSDTLHRRPPFRAVLVSESGRTRPYHRAG